MIAFQKCDTKLAKFDQSERMCAATFRGIPVTPVGKEITGNSQQNPETLH